MATGGKQGAVNQSLRGTLKFGSESILEYYCQPCLQGKEYKNAYGYCSDCKEYLCKACFNYHTKPKSFRNHNITELGAMPIKPPLTVHDIHMYTCSEHSDQKIEFYCPKHDCLGCGRCVAKHKNDCTDMTFISEVATDITENQEYVDIKKTMTTIEKKSSEIMEKIATGRELAQQNTADVTNTSEAFHKQFSALLSDMKMEVVTRVKKIKHRDYKRLDKTEQDCIDTTATVNTIREELDSLNDAKQEIQLFIALKQAKNQLSTAEEKLAEIAVSAKPTKYQLHPEQDLLDMVKHQKTIYRLCEETVDVEKISDINVKSTTDEESCCISGLAILAGRKLVITDRINMKVKMLDLAKEQLISELSLQSEPEGLTAISDSTVAVALPDKQCIKLLGTYPSLCEEKDIKVKGKCQNLAQTDDKLIVMFTDSNNLGIYGAEDGRMKDNIINDAISSPTAVTVSHDQKFLFVSNKGNHSIAKLGWDHKVVGTYSDEQLGDPRQVTTDGQGRIYVCSYRSHTVHQITSDCTKVQVIAGLEEGMYCPTAIAYEHCTNKLYVGVDGNNVKVIQLAYRPIQ